MRIGVLGISYHSAQIAVREKIATFCKQYLQARFTNFVLLSTCNRTEIYFSSEDLANTHTDFFHYLKGAIGPSFEDSFYSYFGKECFLHLSCVTAGLKSAILGESDIQRQVRIAYEEAASLWVLSSALHFLFQKCLKIGKEARSLFPSPMSLETTIWQLVRNIFSLENQTQTLQPLSFFILGYSELNRKILCKILEKQKAKITLCTRNVHLAEPFAIDHGISLVDRTALSSWVNFDVVICGTESDAYLISPSQEIGKARLILDLSLPRVVDPRVGRSPFLSLCTMEEIGKIVAKEREKRLEELAFIHPWMDKKVEAQVTIFAKKQAPFPWSRHIR